MIADPDLHAELDQIPRDIGLNIRKSNDQIRLEGDNALQARAGEGRNTRFLLARAGRSYREPRDANDPRLLTQGVQDLSGLFSQTDNALRIDGITRVSFSASRINCISNAYIGITPGNWTVRRHGLQ
jgi:hypothetical protein